MSLYEDLIPGLAKVVVSSPVRAPLIANKPETFNPRLTYRDETLGRIPDMREDNGTP